MYVLGVEGKCSGLDGSGRDGGWTLRDAAGTCVVTFAAQRALLSGLNGRLSRSNSARNPLPRTGSWRRFRLIASLARRLRPNRSLLGATALPPVLRAKQYSSSQPKAGIAISAANKNMPLFCSPFCFPVQVGMNGTRACESSYAGTVCATVLRNLNTSYVLCCLFRLQNIYA